MGDPDYSDLSGYYVGQAYDQAMDDLTQSQRNELLSNVSMKRAQAKAYQKQMANGLNTPQRGFWKGLLRYSLIVSGAIFQVVGRVAFFFGTLLREWGEGI